MKHSFYLVLLFITILAACNQSKESENSTQNSNDSIIDNISTTELEQALMGSQPATDISDEEFDEFADIYLSIQDITDSIQNEMMDIILGEGMDLDRFNEIAESQQGETPPVLSEIEKAQLEKIGANFQRIQVKQQEKAIAILENSKMGMTRYQSLLVAIQQDEVLQQKLMAIFNTKIETH